MSSLPEPPLSPEDQEFEQTLAEVERSLQALKARYAQVRGDQQRQEELQHQFREAQQQYQRTRSKPLQADLKRLKQQLEELEIALESQLFSFRGLQEAFWMAIRFGGMGIAIGWGLCHFFSR